MAHRLVRVVMWVVTCVAAFVGVVGLIWTTAPGGLAIGLAVAAVGLSISFALYSRLRGGPALRADVTPKRKWAIGFGVALLVVGFFLALGAANAGSEAGLWVALPIWVLGGVLLGIGWDDPKLGWWGVARTAFGFPTVVAVLIALETSSWEGRPIVDAITYVAGGWLVLAAATSPLVLVGIGLHRLALRRMAARVQPAPGPAPNVLRDTRPPTAA